jgi:alpha-methylacyl-CoA racemase
MGPLKGLKVIEFAGIGPGPFCAMMLSDMGAEVIRIERKLKEGQSASFDPIYNPGRFGVLNRGRRSVALDLKTPEGIETALKLIERCDALVEGYRPGVMERLGLGPQVCRERNPRLVYGRMTGWGQFGPLAQAAGHDNNYISITGALDAIGQKGGAPVMPLNLVGDFGGGAMFLAFGIVCALLEAKQSGKGQVVDAAMTDGASLLMSMIYGFKAMGQWSDERGSNLLDGGAHFYTTYECADGKYVSIGSIEPGFYRLLLEITGADAAEFQPQTDISRWPELKEKLAAIFLTKTRGEWCELMEGTDICFAPVLGMQEAPDHAHNIARETFIELDGVVQPAPAPRFDRTPPRVQSPPAAPGEHTEEVLTDYGFDESAIERLKACGAI